MSRAGLACGRPARRNPLGWYDKLYPGGAKFTAGSATRGMYRGLKLWVTAVKEAGSLNQDDVIKALDHAKIEQGPAARRKWCPASITSA